MAQQISFVVVFVSTILPIQWCFGFPLFRGFSLAEDFLIRLEHEGEHATVKETLISNGNNLPRTQHHTCRFYLSYIGKESFTARQYLDHPLEQLLSTENCEAIMDSSFSDQDLCIQVTISPDESMISLPLIQVLAKVLAHHWLLSLKTELDLDLTDVSIRLPDSSSIDLREIQCFKTELPFRLFGLDKSGGGVEMVEMVCQDGSMVGAVPRPLVHQHNLLHRGVGLFVTNGAPIGTDHGAEQPDVYVHRRTSTKRVFPSLYDMFVGGVSGLDEAPIVTAQREVAEELGLQRSDAVSGPFLQCTVCTSYNRCVVDLFCYTADPDEDIQWQEEEVSWGAFVPYSVVEAAADRSIQRCDPWPGSADRYQSPRRGSLPNHERPTSAEWEHWNFVPDGLLVWEAWARWLEDKAENG